MILERPILLLLLLLLPVLYWLERRFWRPRVERVASLLLLEAISERSESAAERGTRWLRFAFLALAWTGLVVCAAAPVLRTGEPPGRDVALVLDTSASMAARGPSGRTRFERAKEAALAFVERLDDRDRVSVVAHPSGGRAAERRSPGAAADRIRRLVPTDLPGRPDARLLADLAASSARPVQHTYVFTDDPRSVAAGARTSVVTVGEAASNLSVHSLVFDDAEGAYTARIRSFAGRPESTRAVLSVDGREVASATAEVPPRGFAAVRLDGPRGDRVAVRIESGGALAADDGFHLTRAPRRSLRVGLVGDPDPSLARALAIDPRVEMRFGGSTEPLDLCVWNRMAPDPSAATHHVVIDPPAAPAGFELGEPGPAGDLVAGDAGEMEGVSFRGVWVGSARAVRAGAGAVVLATGRVNGRDVPLIVRSEGWTVLGFGLDPSATNWTLRPSFPIFFHHRIDRASRSVGASADDLRFVATGEKVVVAGAGVWIGPDGSERALEGAGPHELRLDRVGLHRFAPAAGDPDRVVAAVLASESESDLVAPGSDAQRPPLPLPPVVPREGTRRSELGRLFLILGAVCLAVFYALGRRSLLRRAVRGLARAAPRAG